jgi:hypothetical protein
MQTMEPERATLSVAPQVKEGASLPRPAHTAAPLGAQFEQFNPDQFRYGG